MHRPSRRQLLSAAPALVAARAAFARSLEASQESPRDAYDLADGVVYLNHASIGTVPRAVREAHASYLAACESNPWLYVWGGAWAEAEKRAHSSAARALGVDPDLAAIVRNTTAAFGMAANGLPIGEGHEVLFSTLNHTGASASWEHASASRGFTFRRFDFPERDVASMTRDDVTAAHLAEIRDETEVLVLPHVDNVYGVRHDVAKIARGARARGVRWVLVDGAQSIGMHAVHVDELEVDLYATSAHKWLQAPKGTGLMALSPAAVEAMRPLVVTWGHGRWDGTARAFTDFGTRDIAKLLAVGDAIELHARTSKGREEHHAGIRETLSYAVGDDRRLSWRSPADYEDGGALVAVGLEVGSARAAAKTLFEDYGVVVRGFEGGGRNHLRVSPNTMNTDLEIALFARALGKVLS